MNTTVTFSFDQNLNDVVEANGYEDAYVIFANKTVLGPGGGVCQVSTTAFRAAFWGGTEADYSDFLTHEASQALESTEENA